MPFSAVECLLQARDNQESLFRIDSWPGATGRPFPRARFPDVFAARAVSILQVASVDRKVVLHPAATFGQWSGTRGEIRAPLPAWQTKKGQRRFKFRSVTASDKEQGRDRVMSYFAKLGHDLRSTLLWSARCMILADCILLTERDIDAIQKFKQAKEKWDVRE